MAKLLVGAMPFLWRAVVFLSFFVTVASSFMNPAPIFTAIPKARSGNLRLLPSPVLNVDGSLLQSTSNNAFIYLAHDASITGALSYTAVLGSSLIMLTIVGLLYIWEKSVEWVRESVPKTLLPVVESILGEIGGLGFIGLLLGSILGSNAIKESLESLSIQLFGEEDILVENFEFLHTAFFQVGVGFFIAAGAMVAMGLNKLNEIGTIEGLQLDESTGTCTVTTEKLAMYLPDNCVKDMDTINDISDINLWREITMPKEERAAKTLLMRNEFMKRHPHLDDSFRIESVIQASFAQNLYKIVEVSPLTWIYLIPALALANAIDLSHEVVNAASPNAAESVGYFFSTFESIGPGTFTVVLAAVWGLWNCWKVTQIKYMLIPRLGTDPATGKLEILPPLSQEESARQSFDSSPAWVKPIEGLWSKPAQNELDHLFGAAGGAGIKLYQNSIKYQAWLCLTHIVFFGTQVVPRDIEALIAGPAVSVGDPSHLTAELITFGSYVLLSLLQLVFVAPRAFWNFCLVACLDERMADKLLEMSGNAMSVRRSITRVTDSNVAIPNGLNSTTLDSGLYRKSDS